jgi:hypothetical protein
MPELDEEMFFVLVVVAASILGFKKTKYLQPTFGNIIHF